MPGESPAAATSSISCDVSAAAAPAYLWQSRQPPATAPLLPLEPTTFFSIETAIAATAARGDEATAIGVVAMAATLRPSRTAPARLVTPPCCRCSSGLLPSHLLRVLPHNLKRTENLIKRGPHLWGPPPHRSVLLCSPVGRSALQPHLPSAPALLTRGEVSAADPLPDPIKFW